MASDLKKLKTQKNAAVFLFAIATFVFVKNLRKWDVELYGWNNYIISGGSILLMIITVSAFYRSWRKIRNHSK